MNREGPSVLQTTSRGGWVGGGLHLWLPPSQLGAVMASHSYWNRERVCAGGQLVFLLQQPHHLEGCSHVRGGGSTVDLVPCHYWGAPAHRALSRRPGATITSPCRDGSLSSLPEFNGLCHHTSRKHAILWQQLCKPERGAKGIFDHRWLLSAPPLSLKS